MVPQFRHSNLTDNIDSIDIAGSRPGPHDETETEIKIQAEVETRGPWDAAGPGTHGWVPGGPGELCA